MGADGLKPSILALNSLINAFGEDRRTAEAFAVLQYMKENVSRGVVLLLLFPGTSISVNQLIVLLSYSNGQCRS